MNRPALGLVAALAIAGCGDSTVPSSEPAAELSHVVLLESVVPRWGDGLAQQLLDDFGENTQPLDAGRRAVIVGQPVSGPGGLWVEAWIAPDPNVWPGDFYAWLPLAIDGRPALRQEPPPPCPNAPEAEAIINLPAPDRLRCFGSAPISLDARSWLPLSPMAYDVDPAWYGTIERDPRSASLFDPAIGAGLRGAAEPSIDARIPPGVAPLPADFKLRVTGQFDHPSAATCRRTRNRLGINPPPPAGAGLPIEPPDTSIRWCRQQFVVSRWEVIEGPEERALDPARPQLHRLQPPPPGVFTGCGGVGMPPLTFRIDLTQLDPVWLDRPGGRSIPFFGPEFRLEPGDQPKVTGPGGVVIVDGDPIDPDRGRPNLAVCPGGDIVTFEVPKPPQP